MKLSNIDQFDERFRGYGDDKISFFHAIHKKGARFVVLADHEFVCHVHHKPSSGRISFNYLSHGVRVGQLRQMFNDEIDSSA